MLFFLSYLFLFYNFGDQKGRSGPAQGVGLAPVGRVMWWEKEIGR
jgi:hypothetical protein